VDDRPHIGHAYTTLAADVLARHMRAKDRPARLQTGTNEHGHGVEKAAASRGVPPGEWCDKVSADFRSLWKTLDVSYDRFVRTTDPAHAACVQAVFEKLLGTGDIYRGAREGLYCPSCETTYGEAELSDGACPVHGKPLQRVSGEAYFFRLSRFGKDLLAHYSAHPDFISPRGRAPELIDFVKAGLNDVPVSSPGTAWGVPVKSAPGHTVHVWFDALLGYASGAGYHPDVPSQDFPRSWPPDAQLAGRELLRFHGAVWPAVLMALGLELPRRVCAHGWWTVGGEKMSHSRGNFIKAEDMAREYGVDALRYFLLREVPFGQDGDFSAEAFRRRYNSDLAGDLENLFSRVTKLAAYTEHRLPRKPEGSGTFSELSSRTHAIDRAVEELRFSEALELIWEAVRLLNRLIDERKAWQLAKADPQAMKQFLHELVWCLRLLAGWLDPFMPGTASRMLMQLGVGFTSSGAEPQQVPPLFPRKHDDRPGNPRLN
jgi:methionyl-tRNA synthetase